MSALVNGSSGQICAGCRVWWSARTAGMREEAGDATPGGVQRLMSTPAKAGAGSTSGMPGWLTAVSGTTLWVIRVTPMANWQWTELPALVKTRAGSQDRSHAGQSVAVAPRRGGTAGTGRGAFDYLLSGWGWGPVRSPGRGPPAANPWLTAGVSGDTRTVVTWKVMPRGWTSGQPAANQWGDIGVGDGPVRVRRYSGAGVARIAG